MSNVLSSSHKAVNSRNFFLPGFI